MLLQPSLPKLFREMHEHLSQLHRKKNDSEEHIRTKCAILRRVVAIPEDYTPHKRPRKEIDGAEDRSN